MAMRRCKHTRAVAVTAVEVMTYECRTCGARGVRKLSPANDWMPAIQVDMLDAEAISKIGGVHTGKDLWDVDGDTQMLWSHPYDWSWDISRPIAEQLAETALDDAKADASRWNQLLSYDAMEYEIERSAEPDCRDEDDIIPALDRAATAVGAMVDAFAELVATPVTFGAGEVCACTGDALLSDRCRDFDPMTRAIIPGDFNGPHGGVQ